MDALQKVSTAEERTTSRRESKVQGDQERERVPKKGYPKPTVKNRSSAFRLRFVVIFIEMPGKRGPRISDRMPV